MYKKNIRLFVVDDEKILRVSMSDELRAAGYDVHEFEDPVVALKAAKEHPADIVITDIKRPPMDGITLLSKLKSIRPETIVIVMTAYGSVNSAVQAMKAGAYDYITKPFQMDELLLLLERVEELTIVKQENLRLRSHFESRYSLEAFVGQGEHVRQIHKMVESIARTPSEHRDHHLVRCEVDSGRTWKFFGEDCKTSPIRGHGKVHRMRTVCS